MKKRLRINFIIVLPVILLFVAFPSMFLKNTKNFSVDDIMEIFGLTFILLGQTLRVSARGHKSESSQGGHSLVQTGPYSLVRNPMYLGIMLIGAGIVFLLFKWWTVVIFLLFFQIRYIFLIFKEEKLLLSFFAGEYSVYQKSVPRILPSIKTLFKTDIREYLSLKLSWFKKEIGSILSLLFAVLLIEFLEDIKGENITSFMVETAAIMAVIALFLWLIICLSRRKQDLIKNVSIKSKNSL